MWNELAVVGLAFLAYSVGVIVGYVHAQTRPSYPDRRAPISHVTRVKRRVFDWEKDA